MSEDNNKVASGPQRKAQSRSLRPTIVTPARRNPIAPRGGGKGPAVRVPTTIPGVERTRISVPLSDLKGLSPGAAPQIYDRALALIDGFVPEKVTERKAVLWGHDLQKAYSDLVTETLRLTQAPVLRKVEGYLARMLEILGSIDLMAVCGHDRGGVLGQYFKGINKRIDTPAELTAAQAELDQLVQYMSAALDELLELKDQLEQHSSKVRNIAEGVEAAALAALVLARYFQPNNSVLASRFTERGNRLTQTLAQIRGSDVTREIQIEQPLGMVSAIQHVALVMMPGWLGSVASALTLLGRRNLTKTEASELTHQLREIITQLKTEGDAS